MGSLSFTGIRPHDSAFYVSTTDASQMAESLNGALRARAPIARKNNEERSTAQDSTRSAVSAALRATSRRSYRMKNLAICIMTICALAVSPALWGQAQEPKQQPQKQRESEAD